MIAHYKKYFEDLATASADIEHTEEEPAFFFVNDKYNLAPFDNALKNAAKTPCLLLERYTHDLDDNNNRNYYKHINGRFSVLVSSETGNRQSEEDAVNLAEEIAEKIIWQMRADLGQGGSITANSVIKKNILFSISNIQIDPIGPIALKYHGVTVGFKWRCPFSVAGG